MKLKSQTRPDKSKSILQLLLICAVIIATGCGKNAPKDLPDFKVLLLDSATVINTKDIPAGHPIVLMYFSPDCDHCHKETMELLKNMNAFKDVQIYYISPSGVTPVKAFYEKYKLEQYKNITMAVDYHMAFYQLFKPNDIPYQAVYNGSKKLVKTFDGGTKVATLIKMINKS